jgi:hypothetical protein
MPDIFTFDIDETWEDNLLRLKGYLETQDSECAELLFESLDTLISNDVVNARRDFNQLILAALHSLAEAEIQGDAQ